MCKDMCMSVATVDDSMESMEKIAQCTAIIADLTSATECLWTETQI